MAAILVVLRRYIHVDTVRNTTSAIGSVPLGAGLCQFLWRLIAYDRIHDSIRVERYQRYPGIVCGRA